MITLTFEEQKILKKLNHKQLHFLKRISTDAEFETLKTIANELIDVEKNMFFGEDESKLTQEVLYAKHAYARGGIARLITLIHLFLGAEHELLEREKERKKRKEKNETQES